MASKRKKNSRDSDRQRAGGRAFYAGPWWGPMGAYYTNPLLPSQNTSVVPPLSEQFGGYADGPVGSDGGTGAY